MFLAVELAESISRRLKAIRCWLGIHSWEHRCLGMRRCVDCRRQKRGKR